MKKKKGILNVKGALIVAILVGTVPASYFIGCNRTDKEKCVTADSTAATTDASERDALLEGAKLEYNHELDAFRKDMKDVTETNRRAIAAFKEMAGRQKEQARETYKAQVAALEERNQQMEARLDEYKGEGKEKWTSFRAEFSHDMDELGRAIRDFGKDNVKDSVRK